jgi:hypothetical protein
VVVDPATFGRYTVKEEAHVMNTRKRRSVDCIILLLFL